VSVAAARAASPGELEPNATPASEQTFARPAARANELAAPRNDDRFEVARQLAALERSIELYRMFIERAGDDPRYDEAVRRSRARIDDATVTICFLLEKPCDTGERQ
jgi:hypothetical protein